jgi:AcrR family transcriptional regulator
MPPARKTVGRVPLDRKIILAHAFAILNDMGLEGLTLRRLAARLGVQAPAIYWHFKNKQKYPLAHAAGVAIFGDQDTRFLEGMALIVAGMAALLPTSRAKV